MRRRQLGQLMQRVITDWGTQMSPPPFHERGAGRAASIAYGLRPKATVSLLRDEPVVSFRASYRPHIRALPMLGRHRAGFVEIDMVRHERGNVIEHHRYTLIAIDLAPSCAETDQ